MSTVLIIGATSAIAHETSRRFAAEGARLLLVARNEAKLQANASDLAARGASGVETFILDANDFGRHAALMGAVQSTFPDGLDYALLAYGTLPDQTEVVSDADAAVDAFTTNATSVIALLTHLAGLFEKQERGAIAVISSVAGDRGRPSNYVYGAAKGAVSLFAQGLRARMTKHGVSVTTIKPGFVDTPMTADVPKNRLFADPADVGARIHKAMKKGQDVVYIPAFWRGVMGVIKAIPERVFKKLDL